MTAKNSAHILITVALVAIVFISCERDISGLAPLPLSTDPLMFDDNFGDGVSFYAFAESYYDAMSVDPTEKYQGLASIKIVVPAGGWSGGAFPTRVPRNLSVYNALTFWAKASLDTATLDVAGLGNDNTGTSKYTAEWKAIGLTSSWKKYIVPIPLPAKLASERGLFFFADNTDAENGVGYSVWFDEVKFESVSEGTITNPRPIMSTQTVSGFAGARVNIKGTSVTFKVGNADQKIDHMPGYFTFTSSDPDVATVSGETVRAVAAGSAIITAALGPVPAVGQVALEIAPAPTTAAPRPTVPGADVMSLFSNAYTTGVTVDTWLAEWSEPRQVVQVADFRVAGDDVKVYTDVNWAGIEFTSNTINITDMTGFHIDAWIPEGLFIKVKLVDFGANNVYDGPGSDDSEHELGRLLDTESWGSFDIPLSEFSGLSGREHVAQLVISGASTIFVDNIYFHK